MMPLLPHELSDRIIDFLHDDRSTLSKVSLVCRSFLPATRYHRFSNLVLVGSRIERFNQLLDISPNLGAFVSNLVLNSGLSHTVWRRLSAETLSNMLQRMPALQFLDLRFLRLQDEVMDLIGTIKVLHSLSLVGCNVPSADSLAYLLGRLESLVRLEVEDLNFSEECAIGESVERPHILTLSATGLTDEATNQICSWILDDEGRLDILSFHTRLRSRAEAIATKNVIEQLGGTLTDFQMVVDAEASLTCELSSIPSESSGLLTDVLAVFGESDIDLGCLTNLRSCRLVFKLREMCVPENLSLPWISTLVSQLSSSYLSNIAVNIQADNVQDLRALDSECGVRETFPVRFGELQALDWAAIEGALDNRLQGSLTVITMEGIGNPGVLQDFLHLSHPILAGLIRLIHA
ncbi:hypothetical protein NM688_g3927 [Phlebia brevispora]|uniref:Uncharacterized protein n=1 Tax=Phlebia brevispora TaxID=194682 RepID=A0ACC1T4D0_9APHY|nr:hypothetical protein NM688_g3927 [Phlebia brevispora]